MSGLHEHVATFPATSSLVSSVGALRAEAAGLGQRLVLCAASITNGTEIADAYGASGLEAVTAEVARRAVGSGREGTRLLRASPLGGFLVAVLADPDAVQPRVEALARALRTLVSLDGDQIWPVVSVGVRACTAEDEVWAAIRDARATLFAAGRDQPGSTRWHRADVTSARGDLELVRDLARTLESSPEQLTLAYQSVHDLRTRSIVSAEALLRWHHPERGAVPPAVAVEAAERTGLVVPLGRRVLDMALHQTSLWRSRLRPTFRIHVNVSPHELREASYVDAVRDALATHGVPASMLLLELTETALLNGGPQVMGAVDELRGLGVALGIDDFGTGYSSIAHLHDLPVDTVKVDRSLIAGIATSPADFALTRAVFGLLATTDATVVAEGVEDAVQASHLQAVGCRFAQGFHLGRPVPAADFLPALTHDPQPATA